MKKLRLVSLFSGYDSQALALKYLGVDFEHYKTCEWAVKSIQATKDLHFGDDDTDYSKGKTKEELIEWLYKKGISADYNKPMEYAQIKRLGEEKIRTIYNNIKATHNLVNISQVKGGDLGIEDRDKYTYMMTYSFPCITEDSLILTKDGYKEFRELQVGEYVLTKSNTWQKISKKFDNGIHKTYYLQGMGFENIHCTDNHKFLVRKKYRKGHKSIRCFTEPEFKEVKDITKDYYFGVPVIKEEEIFYRDDLDFWYMIGYYLGDGWLCGDKKDIILACNDKKLEKLKNHLDLQKWKYTYHWNSSCYRLRFRDKEIYDFISKYIGTGSFEKRICGEILRLPKEQLKSLLEGYIDSDGCRIKQNIQFSSVNRGLIYGISAIINKIYHRTTCISKNIVKPQKNIQGRIVNQHDWYLLRFKENDNKQDKAFYEDGYLWYPFTKLIEAQEEHVYNMEIENDHSYIIQGCISKNCQDLSLAGRGLGMDINSGTRSSLIWEVGRILKELKIKNQLPDFLLLENVPQVHSKKNIEDFNLWIESLNELGYKSVYKDLNTKNFKVPQNRNRCFMVSILDKERKFKMPEDIGLTLRLKDVLEKNVDEKYYLSDKMLTYVSSTNEWYSGNRTNCKINKNPASTITTRETNARADCSNYVSQDLEGENINLRQLGQLYPNTGNPQEEIVPERIGGLFDNEKGRHQAGSIWGKEKLSPTLDTAQGGYRTPLIEEDILKREVANKCLENKLVEPNDIIDVSYSKSRLKEMEEGYIQKKNTEDNQCANTLTTAFNNMGVCIDEEITEPLGCASRGRNPENPSSRKSGEKTEQRIEINKSGCSNCLTTVQKDTYVIEPNNNPPSNK